MPRRYASDGTPLFNGKKPEDFTQEDVQAFISNGDKILENINKEHRIMSDKTETTGQATAQPLKLDVFVRLIEPRDNLLGFANITLNDSLRIDDFKIVNGEKGLFVGMPSKAGSKNGETKYYDTVRPVTKEFRAELNEAVVTAYHLEVEKLQARVDAAKSAPSIQKQLADGADKAAKENAARSSPAKAKKEAER